MRNRAMANRLLTPAPLALVLATAFGATGCQIQVGGQTLPSPYYLSDDVQYFGPGPEFKLAREAAAQKAFANDQGQLAAGPPGVAPAAGPPPVPAPPPPPPGPGAGAAKKKPLSGGLGWMFSNDGMYTTGG